MTETKRGNRGWGAAAPPHARGTGLDDAGARERTLREVVDGLRAPRKRIDSRFHYDARGSELFEEITRLDEYYPTRTERRLLRTWAQKLVAELRPAALVELGAGSAEKSRIILDAMVEEGSGRAYVPVDVSAEFLQEVAAELRVEYPQLEVVPVAADIASPLPLPSDLPEPAWIAFLGSTLGNFGAAAATELLGRIRRRLRPDDRFLLGIDLRPGPHKTAERIERAYNDASGVTEAFSLNVLDVLNAELGSDFDTSAFRHRARYDPEAGRIETDLVSLCDQTVTFPDGSAIELSAGEPIRTEISCKYDRPTIDGLFGRAGLVVDRWVEDERGYYALVLARAA